MRRALAGVAVCFVVAVSALTASASDGPSVAQAASRSCGSFRLHGLTYDVTIERGHVPCRAARKVLRAFMNGKGRQHGSGPEADKTWPLSGWTCGHGTG